MSIVNTGVSANDGSGDSLRGAFQQINARIDSIHGRGEWAPGELYSAAPVREWVTVSGVAYVVSTTHVSGPVFTDDLTAGKWMSGADVMQLEAAIAGNNGASRVGTRDGRTVQQRLDALPDEIDPAGTAASRIAEHNADAGAHQSLLVTIAAAVSSAESARDAAIIGAGLYADESTGRAAVADGAAFKVQGSGDVAAYEYRRVNSTTSTLLATYPASSAVKTPSWAGKRSGWPDPFFRRMPLSGAKFLGRDRWHGSNSAGEAFGGWSKVQNARFDGFALRRAGSYNITTYSGPCIHMDELGAVAGDTITAYLLIGGSGDLVYGSHRWLNSAGAQIGVGLMSNAAGNTNGITSSATPQWLRISETVPANAARVALWPYCLSGSSGFDVLACWAFKGGVSEGPDWPTLEDGYLSANAPLVDERLAVVESSAAPYVAFQHPLGPAEMQGDATYGTKVIALYEQMTSRGVFNQIELAAWATDPAATIEWRIWRRAVATAFNMATTPADHSGTFAPGSFPTSNAVSKLLLGTKVTAEAGEYVFFAIRAANDTNVNVARWSYNAAVSPARHGFGIGTANGWDQDWALTGPTIGYGQATFTLYARTEESLAIEHRVQALEESSGTAAADLPFFTIPSTVYAVAGTELNLYHDAVFSAPSDGLSGFAGYTVEISGPVGRNKRRCWRLNAAAGEVGTHGMTARAWDAHGNLVATRMFSVVVQAATGKASAKNVLMVGDSLTADGVITSTVRDKFVSLGGVTPGFLGSQGSAPSRHEGRGGKSFGFYATSAGVAYRFTVAGVGSVATGATYTVSGVTYTVTEVNVTAGSGTIAATGASAPPASGTLTKSSGAGDATLVFSSSATEAGNPFWSGGAMNIAAYRATQGIAAPLDAVTIQLGVNDVFSASKLTNFASMVTYAKTIADAFLADNPACNVIVALPTICGNTNDGFAANYGAAYTRRIYESNLFGLRAALIAAFDGGAHHVNVRVGAVGLAVDRWYGYASSSTAVASRMTAVTDEHVNGVHPGLDGYEQAGDAMFCDLMASL